MSERFVQRADPEEVFGALSNDTRVAIIRTLRETDGHEATFSDLPSPDAAGRAEIRTAAGGDRVVTSRPIDRQHSVGPEPRRERTWHVLTRSVVHGRRVATVPEGS